MAKTFRTTRLVEFHDTDMAGIMHFASFFHYMESAEHELLRSIGFSIHSLVEGQLLSFPRVAASCQYQSPARSEQVLDIAVHVTRIGEKSLTYKFDFSCEGLQVATGQMTCVCCRVETGAPLVSRPIPADLVARLQQYRIEPSDV